MLLQRKVDRAMKWSRERSLRAEGIDPEDNKKQNWIMLWKSWMTVWCCFRKNW